MLVSMLITLQLVIQALISGVLLGLIYGLMGSGLSLTFGVLGVLNAAHGALYMLAGFLTFTIVSMAGFSPWIGLAASVVVLFVLGMGIEVLSIEFVKGDTTAGMLVCMALAILIENIVLLIFGGLPKIDTSLVYGSVTFLSYYADLEELLGAVLVIALGLGLTLFLARSKTGKAIRMLAYDRETSRVLGINVTLISMLTFGLGSSVAGVAGSLLSTIYPVSPDSGWNILVICFAVVTLGGVGSIRGTLVGGIVFAVAQNLMSLPYPEYSQITGLVVLIVVLLVKPTGISGSRYVITERV